MTEVELPCPGRTARPSLGWSFDASDIGIGFEQ
jgi:hypothetical protein